MRAVALVIALWAFWILLSGMFTPFLLSAGLIAAILIALLARRMEVADSEGHPIHLAAGVLSYWPWLAKEIAVSAWHVTKIILHPRLPISPVLARFRPSQRTTVGLVTHANSITLTPGTVTVEAAQDEFLVHALTREGARALAGSEMDRRVQRLEGRA